MLGLHKLQDPLDRRITLPPNEILAAMAPVLAIFQMKGGDSIVMLFDERNR